MQTVTEKQRILDRSVVLAALMIPAAVDYGFRIVMLCAAAASVSMLTELICLYLRHDPFRLRHLDAAVTGVILTMLMPPTVPLSLLMISCIFAIIIGRQVFGGKDRPLFPPAAVGFCFAFLNQKLAVQTYPAEKCIIPLFDPEKIETVSGLTDLWNHSSDFRARFSDVLLGVPRLPIGTGSLLLLLTAALVLIFRRSARAWTLLPMLSVIVSGNLIMTWYHNPMPVVYASLLTNQSIFAVMFLFSDPDYAPPGIFGALYGVFCGLLCVLMTRMLFIADAPVILSVFLAPLAYYLRSLIEQAKQQNETAEGGVQPDEASENKPADPQQSPAQ